MSKTNFRQNLKNLQDIETLSLQELISQMLNLLAFVERKMYLEKHPFDKGNGFFSRTLNTGSLNLSLQVPRTRKGDFRPFFLPEKWQRHTPADYRNLVFSFLISSRSIEAAKRAIRELNVPVSNDYIDELISEVKEEVELLNSSPLDPDWFALIMDAKEVNLKVKNSITKYSVFSVIGINFEGKKNLILCEVFEGKENLEKWKAVLKKLLARGVRRVLIVVHDDLPGLSNITSSYFPQSDIQLCTVHMLRNAQKYLNKKTYSRFKEVFRTIKHCFSEELGRDLYQELVEIAQQSNPSFAERLISKKNQYLAFLKYPCEVRSCISSTNLVESVNRKIEDAELLSGGYFHSEGNLKMRLGLVIRELHLGKWRKPNWKIKSVSHILKAMFETRFENNCMEVQTQCS